MDGRASDCPSSKNAEVESILKWAHFAGKSTGIVTTTRVCKFIVWNLLLITWAINLFFFKLDHPCYTFWYEIWFKIYIEVIIIKKIVYVFLACYAHVFNRNWEGFDGINYNETIQNQG